MDRILKTPEKVKSGLHKSRELEQINSGDNNNRGQPKGPEYSGKTAPKTQQIESLAQLLQKDGDFLTIKGLVEYPNKEIKQMHETTQRGKDGQLETTNHLPDKNSSWWESWKFWQSGN